MINGQPEISISFFSELASIIYSLGFHNLSVNIISILETKLYQIPVAVMHWRVCYLACYLSLPGLLWLNY